MNAHKVRRQLSVAILIGPLFALPAMADPVKLWSMPCGGSFGASPGSYIPPEERWVEFTTQWGLSPNTVTFGEGLHWPDGAAGCHDFTDENTSLEDWERFVTIVTTPATDPAGDGFMQCVQAPIGGMCFAEYGLDLNFSGYLIDCLRLCVDDVTFDPDPPKVGYDCSATWQIWGVPEPATVSVLGLGALMFIRRRRRT